MRLLFALTVMSLTLLSSTAYAGPSENKRIVTEFYTQAFIEKDPQAARQYLGDTYTQHNPAVKSGVDEFINFVVGLHAAYPQLKSQIKRVVAEDDLVVLHVFSQPTPEGNGLAIIDIFRVENGKVVEHWDVKQNVPDPSENGNSMF